MNASETFLCLLTCVALSGVGAAAPAGTMQDSPSFDDATLARRKALAADPVKNLKPATGEDPAKARESRSLLSDSDIISFQGLATLVPKRAIILTPKNYAAYLKFEPGSKLVSWSDFYNANRAWITTVEVSRNQAEGKEPLSEQTQKMLGTTRNLVVATFRGGPISVISSKSQSGAPNQNGAASQPQPTPKP